MKSKLLILMFLTSFTIFSQNTIIPDSNFESKLIALGIDKDGKNGKVLTSSITNVTTLDVSFSNISDLSGIQDFGSLTSLVCYLNNLTSLDLSKNIKLSTIDCRANKIKNLDVSNLKQLVGLLCSENFLTSIDVSKNPLVSGVFCSKNNLISLNLKNGNNTNFQEFFCDFRNNPLLNCIQVDNLDYSNSKWANYKDATTIYSSSCGPSYTNIPDSNFENKLISLGIDNDGLNGKVLTSNVVFLTDLNISSSSIANLSGIENFINLETLNISNNQLALLNIPTLQKIKNLDCSKNFLKQLDFTENKVLQTLNFSNNQVSSIDLGYQDVLETLIAGSNELTTIDISPFSNLKKLEINDNKLTNLSLYNKYLLSFLNCSNNLLTSLELSENNALISLYCGTNKLIKLDITANLLLKEITCQSNLLTQLNLKNGKNSLFTNYDFRNNPSLACIEVDNENYSNINWSTKKDATTTYNVYCGPFTLIPDPKFEDKLIALGIDIDGKNGKVLTISITNLTTLDLSNSLITDLSGIQDFVSLKTLNVSSNLLTKLEVSNNTKLTSLSCESNQITSLDVSKNLALTSFYCGLNNLITLEVSKNVSLTSLACSSNVITSLDISKNILLKEFYCNNNKLSYLNLKNGRNTLLSNSKVSFLVNPNLSCILVDNESYSNTNWSDKKDAATIYSVDCIPLSAYTLIPDTNFEKRLFSLGIESGVIDGKVLTSKLISVTYLNLSDALISDLSGIQAFTALKILDCGRNNLMNIDISQNKALETLICNNNQLSNIDVSKNQALIALSCSYNQLTNLDVSQNQALSTLDFNANKLINIDISKNTTLKHFQGDNNQLNNLDISQNVNLTTLDCRVNLLTNLDVSKNIQLYSLHCSYNKLTTLTISNLLLLNELFCNNNKLRTLDVSQNKALQELYCANNEINILTLGNAPIYELYCGSNQLTELDISGNIQLRLLHCESNRLSGLNFSKNSFLNDFNVSYNQITTLDLSKNKIRKLFCDNNNLEHLNLKNGDTSYTPDYNVRFSGNPNLSCIQVSDLFKASFNWSSRKDPGASFSLYCAPTPYITISSKFEDKLISLGLDTDGKNESVLATSVINLKSLDVSNAGIWDLSGIEYFTSLEKLIVKNNSISKIDLDNLKLLKYLDCANNSLEPINFANNTELEYLDCSNNSQIHSLYVGKNKLLKELYLDNVQLARVYVNVGAVYYIISVDLSNNTLLTKLSCSNTFMETLNLSKNTQLTYLNCSKNRLTDLNLNNNNNTILSTIDLKSNPYLTCISVDNKVYSDINWTNFKDSTAKFSIDCNAPFLPSNNFIIESKGETCLNQNNGEININANATHTYIASINNINYPFTNNSLQVGNLAPGLYSVSITIPGEIFEQKFNITITKGQTITGKSSIVNNKIVIEIESGTAPYKAYVNGIEQFETTATVFDVVANKYDLVEIVTAKTCEGVYVKKATDVEGTLLAYPNPTSGILEIELPISEQQVEISLSSTSGHLISNNTYSIENGKVKLNLENLSAGIYIVKIGLETPEYLKIVKN